MEKIKIFDYLGISKDKETLKLINNEKIYYSGFILKIKHLGKNQERNIILTNKNIYTFKKSKMKRTISLSSILGISYSSISNEFIIHGNIEHDFHFQSDNKILLICLILVLYQEIEDMIMPLCEINEKSLKDYVTNKKDKKKNKKMTKLDLSFQINAKTFIDTYRHLFEKEEINKKKPDNKKKNLKMMTYSDYPDFIILESKIKIEHFILLKEIKRDFFGPIIIGKYLKDNQLYILKFINKYFLIKRDLIERKAFEKKILQKLEYPFINKMIFCFQREDKIFFGFDYFKSTDLYHQLCLLHSFPEDIVKFFASIIGLTLEFLHKNKIVYRDFNLKNIIINEQGYLLFDNFFNSKLIEEPENNYEKYNGEMKYFAPEIIIGEGQSFVSDWWSFGIIIYEMLYGITPFFDEDNDVDLYDKILNDPIIFPKKPDISAEAKDLLQKLLVKEKNDRLGFDGGFEVIKKHYFFKGIDFDNLRKKTIESPFKPTITEEIYYENEDLPFFDNISKIINSEGVNENKIEFLKNNQDKFSAFYE